MSIPCSTHTPKIHCKKKTLRLRQRHTFDSILWRKTRSCCTRNFTVLKQKDWPNVSGETNCDPTSSCQSFFRSQTLSSRLAAHPACAGAWTLAWRLYHCNNSKKRRNLKAMTHRARARVHDRNMGLKARRTQSLVREGLAQMSWGSSKIAPKSRACNHMFSGFHVRGCATHTKVCQSYDILFVSTRCAAGVVQSSRALGL